MKYIKSFESSLTYNGPIENAPKVGDYVLCKDYTTADINDRIESKIGRISSVVVDNDNDEYYTLKYDNKEYKNNSYMRRHVRFYEFIYWSKTKEDVEAFINQNKYNL